MVRKPWPWPPYSFGTFRPSRPLSAERGDGVFGEGGVAIDGCCPRREILVRDSGGLGHDPLLIFIEAIHAGPPLTTSG